MAVGTLEHAVGNGVCCAFWACITLSGNAKGEFGWGPKMPKVYRSRQPQTFLWMLLVFSSATAWLGWEALLDLTRALFH